jgi:hypothetical protein
MGAGSSACGGNSEPNDVLGVSETSFARRRSAGALRAFNEHKRDHRVHNPRFAGLLGIESIPSKCFCYTSASRIIRYSNFRNNAQQPIDIAGVTPCSMALHYRLPTKLRDSQKKSKSSIGPNALGFVWRLSLLLKIVLCNTHVCPLASMYAQICIYILKRGTRRETRLCLSVC